MFTYWLLLDILALISTFGFGVALNMVVRRGWVSPVLYGIFAVYLLVTAAARMSVPEWILFLLGLVGALLSGWAVRSLRKHGYSLFSR